AGHPSHASYAPSFLCRGASPHSLFVFYAPVPPEIYTLSLHDALPILTMAFSVVRRPCAHSIRTGSSSGLMSPELEPVRIEWAQGRLTTEKAMVKIGRASCRERV